MALFLSDILFYFANSHRDCVRSEMGCISLSFAALAVWNSLPQHSLFVPQIHHRLSNILKTFLCKKSLPPNFRLQNVASVFNLDTCYGLLPISSCIFHIASFLQNIWIPLRESPQCLLTKTNKH